MDVGGGKRKWISSYIMQPSYRTYTLREAAFQVDPLMLPWHHHLEQALSSLGPDLTKLYHSRVSCNKIDLLGGETRHFIGTFKWIFFFMKYTLIYKAFRILLFYLFTMSLITSLPSYDYIRPAWKKLPAIEIGDIGRSDRAFAFGSARGISRYGVPMW